jgi:hypothetical protein
MRTFLRGKITLLFMTCAVLLAIPAIALADIVANDLDTTVDNTAEVMGLQVGGANGTSKLYVINQNTSQGDTNNACNLAGASNLQLDVTSSNPGVATVSPASVTIDDCTTALLGKTITVTPVSAGSTTISVARKAGTGSSAPGTFNLAPATFTVNVTPPPNTPPTVTVAGVTGGASYNKGSVPAATCQVTDTEDGNSSFAATLGPITGPNASDGLGSQEATCSYTDQGPGPGLTATASVFYNIVDPSGPVITKVVTPASPNGDNGWYKSGNVTVVWTVSDPESPNSIVKTGCNDQNITADQAATTYSCSATSAGGNAAEQSVTIKRDATDPTINGSRTPAANGFGWNNGDVAVNFMCDDGLSDIASCGPNQTLSTNGADQSVQGTATDNAGNTASDTVSGINIDKTNPNVNVTGVSNGATYTLGSVPAAGCSTSDALSGVDANATLQPLSGGPLGSVTATCSGASDKAGNSGSASVTYNVHYNWTGFFRPVDNPEVLNSVKAGQSIPVKFSLAGNQGLNIFATGSPTSQKINCDSSDPIDLIEETVTAGGSSLSYDASNNQYNYVWKSDKAWAGTCRQLSVKLIDGTTHVANFKFLK